MKIFLHNLSFKPNTNPDPKIKTTHGCTEGIDRGFAKKRLFWSCGCNAEGFAKAFTRLHEATVVAPEHAQNGVMERSPGLRGALVVARDATMVTSWSIR